VGERVHKADSSRPALVDAVPTRREERPPRADQPSTINCPSDALGQSRSRGRRPAAGRIPPQFCACWQGWVLSDVAKTER